MSDLDCSCGATCSQVEALQAEVDELRDVLQDIYGQVSGVTQSTKELIGFRLENINAKV